MESTEERDEFVAARVIAGEFHGGLDGLRPRVAEVDPPWNAAWSKSGEPFGEFHHVFVIEVGSGHVYQPLGLPVDRFDDPRMAVTGGDYGDAGIEIQKPVSVHILDNCTLAALGYHRIRACVRGRQDTLIALDHFACLRAGERRQDVGKTGTNRLDSSLHLFVLLTTWNSLKEKRRGGGCQSQPNKAGRALAGRTITAPL